MYPAQALLDGIYGEDDLPDSIFMFPFDLSDQIDDYIGQEIQRNGRIYGPVDFGPYTQRIGWREDFLALGPAWTADTIDAAIESLPCLSESVDGNGYWSDMFADTYAFTAGENSGVLTRQSGCVWSGDGGVLSFVSTSTFVGWTFGGVRKDGLQNTPVGTYGSAEITE
jgi:hypothetical protein